MESNTPQLGAPVKHLLVDLDGTLLGNHGFHLSFDFIGRSLKALTQYGSLKNNMGALYGMYREVGKPSKDETNDRRMIAIFAERMGMGLDEARKVLREGLFSIFPMLERHFYPIPGSKEFLEWARTQYPLTLATNPIWPPEIIEMRVKWAGIDPSIFGFITHVRMMKATKPHPEYYQEILDLQGLNAADCMLIGDNVRMDLPATRVGIRVFILKSPQAKQKTPDISTLKYSKARAQAWRGTYAELRNLLKR
jgi:FMN phosphatase YigB (HAD superfamily)